MMPSLKLVSDQNPRQIAARILSQRQNAGEFTESLLEIALSAGQLSPPDRGLCQELVYGVVRWQATLDQLIARKTTQPGQKSALQNLLRLGLYQIFWLDRIPPHAAVHETVELAKRSGFNRQAGFINAVLRGNLREMAEIRKILTDMKQSNPALGYSHPAWLVEKWQKQFGVESTQKLLEWNNTPPPTFARVNTLKTDGAKLVERWREEDVEYDFVRRPDLAENLVFELKAHLALSRLGSFRDGWFYIQDPSTLLAPALLDAKPGETVLDLCAAPGGKTTFLAQLMDDHGRIVAQDVTADRLKLIRENCERLGITCVETVLQEALDAQPKGQFDRVLVDAPCSNTGVMRRRVDLRWRILASEVDRLAATQLKLLQQASTHLKPGGTMVYSTCSLETEENGSAVKQFLAANPEFELVAEKQLLPFVDQMDGAYVAALKHVGKRA
jgi:16S rRNA (cytosine967-C5)-methyltransferase